jgi:hypothetical protein
MQRNSILNLMSSIKKVIHRQIEMNNQRETPYFYNWEHGNLAKFATDCYIRLQDEQAANEQLRLDLKDAMKLARQQNLGQNANVTQKPTI